LNAGATLSPGQMADIDRVYRDYPHLTDDDFVAQHLNEWLSDGYTKPNPLSQDKRR